MESFLEQSWDGPGAALSGPLQPGISQEFCDSFLAQPHEQ